jgi:hypothetical protein
MAMSASDFDEEAYNKQIEEHKKALLKWMVPKKDILSWCEYTDKEEESVALAKAKLEAEANAKAIAEAERCRKILRQMTKKERSEYLINLNALDAAIHFMSDHCRASDDAASTKKKENETNTVDMPVRMPMRMQMRIQKKNKMGLNESIEHTVTSHKHDEMKLPSPVVSHKNGEDILEQQKEVATVNDTQTIQPFIKLVRVTDDEQQSVNQSEIKSITETDDIKEKEKQKEKEKEKQKKKKQKQRLKEKEKEKEKASQKEEKSSKSKKALKTLKESSTSTSTSDNNKEFEKLPCMALYRVNEFFLGGSDVSMRQIKRWFEYQNCMTDPVTGVRLKVVDKDSTLDSSVLLIADYINRFLAITNKKQDPTRYRISFLKCDKSTTSNSSNNSSNTTAGETVQEQQFPCTECIAEFTTEENLAIHFSIYHVTTSTTTTMANDEDYFIRKKAVECSSIPDVTDVAFENSYHQRLLALLRRPTEPLPTTETKNRLDIKKKTNANVIDNSNNCVFDVVRQSQCVNVANHKTCTDCLFEMRCETCDPYHLYDHTYWYCRTLSSTDHFNVVQGGHDRCMNCNLQWIPSTSLSKKDSNVKELSKQSQLVECIRLIEYSGDLAKIRVSSNTVKEWSTPHQNRLKSTLSEFVQRSDIIVEYIDFQIVYQRTMGQMVYRTISERTPLTLCGGCRMVSYCSDQCREDDVDVHKAECDRCVHCKEKPVDIIGIRNFFTADDVKASKNTDLQKKLKEKKEQLQRKKKK